MCEICVGNLSKNTIIKEAKFCKTLINNSKFFLQTVGAWVYSFVRVINDFKICEIIFRQVFLCFHWSKYKFWLWVGWFIGQYFPNKIIIYRFTILFFKFWLRTVPSIDIKSRKWSKYRGNALQNVALLSWRHGSASTAENECNKLLTDNLLPIIIDNHR